MNSPRFSPGETLFWRTQAGDQNVTISHLLGEQDGNLYYAIKESSTGIPESQLRSDCDIESERLLSAALAYAAQGWHVFPLVPKDKRPLTSHGGKEGATDAAQIRAWWGKWPDANIGIACGASGLLVLDFDLYRAGYQGDGLLKILTKQHPTTEQQTGGGGVHLLYQQADGQPLGNRRGDLPAGVDVRGEGGYIIVPPSLHPSGNRYAWAAGRWPHDLAPQPLPRIVLDLLRPHNAKQATPLGLPPTNGAGPTRYAQKALENELAMLAGAPMGQRNEQLNRSAFALARLVGGGELQETDVVQRLYETATAIGLDKGEIGRTLGSAMERGKQQPRHAPPPSVQKPVKPSALSKNGASPRADDTDGTDDAPDSFAPADHKPTQAEILYDLAVPRVNVFTSQDGTAYGLVLVDAHRECYRIMSDDFSGWLIGLYRALCGKRMPSKEARQQVAELLKWDARGTPRDVFLRVGEYGGKVYIDLGTEKWNAVEVDADGWRLVDAPPVAFRRSTNLKSLPLPVRGATLAQLRPYVNIEPEDWPLVAAWLIAAANPAGPYPILVLAGEQGTAKSTTLRVLSELLDPSAVVLRGQPEDIRDLWVGANNSWALAFDNVSHLHNEVSDALCRLSTGGGYAKRANYTDDGEFLMKVQRPVAINGIGDIVTRPDLMDRCILLSPPVISDEKRRGEQDFWAAFEREHASLFGALLDALSLALRNLPDVQLPTLPRMADFARLAVAAEPAYQDGTSFLDAYQSNRDEVYATAVDISMLGNHLRALVLVNGVWEGTPSELLEEMNQRATDTERRSPSWPNYSNKLKGAIERIAPSLRRLGVDVDFSGRVGKTGSRIYRVTRVNA